MGSSDAKQKQDDDPKVTRALEREWVVGLMQGGRGRPSHQSGRLTLAEAEKRVDDLRALHMADPGDVLLVVHRPPRARQPVHTRRYYCRRCGAVREVLPPAPRSCVGCGLNEYMVAGRRAAAAVAS